MHATPDGIPLGLSRLIQHATISQVVTSVVLVLVVRWVVRGVQRVYFHPLSRFPGPKFAAATRIPQLVAIWTGTNHTHVCKLHEKYGNIVRTAPDELSFVHPDAWRDIHGHGLKGTAGSPPPKNFTRYGNTVNGKPSMIIASDGEHQRQRRIFTPAFSDRALKQQEPLFLKYINLLVQKLKEGSQENPNHAFNMVDMYTFTTFDVMGDLTFGEPLQMLANTEYHPWVSIVFDSVKMGSRFALMFYYPMLRKVWEAFVPESFAKKRFEHFQHSVNRVTKRLEKGRESEGVDLWTLVLKQHEGKGLSRDEMDSNAALFMIAGTETTATIASGLTYLLVKNPECMRKVVQEIRSIPNEDDMHLESLAALPYLNACIKEAFRIYPPVSIGLPHLTPPQGSTIAGEFIPPGWSVTVPQLAMYTSSRNFKEPHDFIPERWMGDERFASDQRAAVQPFSVGSRDCLGKNMAYHELRLIMAKVLYNFDIELRPESDNWIDRQRVFNLWEKPPLLCKLKPVH
ncbi:cytochrome P450 [Massariosphaeria phaeospora]|uniref:Cytochrome P450 n=1 Tax=Massariosphaeria phaeospora TaxID=100035 RepID=A0A7C8IBG0_9PLEO|nr:cytochrome P450 [Massariosphaeria phaeospora]